MKKIWIGLVCLFLFGCSANPSALETTLKQKIGAEVTKEPLCIADNHKTLFSYYAEPSVGRMNSTITSNIFLYEGAEIVMNLDVSTVMNTKYYPDLLSSAKPNGDELVFLNGVMSDCSGNEHEYSVSVYMLNNGKYYVDFQSHHVNFYSTMNYVMVDDVVVQMLKIARSVEVNELEIISYTSSKPADEHQREKVDLFQEEVAENGRLDELIGVTDSGEFTEDEPEIEDPVEDMPDVWIDELIPEEY